MPSLGQVLYWHAPAWQVAGVVLLTAALIAWLSWRTFHADRDRALSQVAPELRNQALFLFDRRAGLRPLNRRGRALLVGDSANDPLVAALTAVLEGARAVERQDWPSAGSTLLAIPLGDSGGPATAALGIVVDETLAPAAAAAVGGGQWITLGPSVKAHASRPVVLILRGAEVWEEAALTPVEDALLRHLLRFRGEVRSAAELFAVAWPDDPADPFGLRPDQNDRLRRLIFQMRQRLEPDPSQPRHLRTARGIGYALYCDEGTNS